jgi:hypothetical protein
VLANKDISICTKKDKKGKREGRKEKEWAMEQGLEGGEGEQNPVRQQT